MVYGGVGQTLNVKKLPEGIKMASQKEEFTKEVSPNINNGRIFGCQLSSLSNFDSGEGPSVEVTFALAGQVMIDSGETITIAQTGSVTVATPEWAGFWAVPPYHNPDQVLVSYNLAGGNSLVCQNTVPKSLQTKNLSVEFVVVQDTKQLAMRVSTDPNFVMDVVNVALFAIQKGHEMAYSWVFGAIGGAPAALSLVAGGLGTEVPKWLEDLVKK
ncbi:hypothetical protein GLAREA_04723 [Glarea lozoyensis ATCC 20868]|uniref:Uncharacterized protein n=1 Tax=Glarea lozoyensis (strain ATCC 20868 / MF5171) TaxID=1116229 RepID=S3CN79_GLAL2|nr:uncharacterized protein GLAREA_04723 [Glarea lozoyensis ATCC 20868]EPE27932.1 hypothetical protein GLAREA_04723 [Glarea lozoyensis ATCC 20868]